MKEFKIGELVLFCCDESLPCVGMVSQVTKEMVHILTVPSYNPFSHKKEYFYPMEEVKKKLKV